MAKRLLLTFLALLGLAAQVAPAHAEACGRAASALVMAADEAAQSAGRSAAVTRAAVPFAARVSAVFPAPAAAAPRLVPVLIGIDRARE